MASTTVPTGWPSPPVVGTVTARVYADLPELYRDADEAQLIGVDEYDLDDDDPRFPVYIDDDDPDAPVVDDNDPAATITHTPRAYPLLRYLSLLLDQLTPVDDTLNAIAPHLAGPGRWTRYGSPGVTYGTLSAAAPTSALVNPRTAPAAWLPWLGRLVGVDVSGRTVDEARDAIAHPDYEVGTAAAIADAIRARSSARYVHIENHYRGDPFRIQVTVDRDEVGAVSWADLEENLPTAGDWEAAGNWQNIAAAGVFVAIESQRPAGFLVSTGFDPPFAALTASSH